MADSLANMKEKLEFNTLAYSPANGIWQMDNIREAYSDAIIGSLNLPDSETRTKIHDLVEKLASLKPIRANKDNDFWAMNEWTEAVCWHLVKYPRINEGKWRYWFTGTFDILDTDHDGYIDASNFSAFYSGTRRIGDKEFLNRAFAAIDTSNSGKVSKEQYVSAYMRYMTDPDVTYKELPLY